MRAQLFTVRREKSRNGKKRTEQLFTAGRKIEKGDRDREKRQRRGREAEMERGGALKGRFYPEKS